jgi:hypothetical protein
MDTRVPGGILAASPPPLRVEPPAVTVIVALLEVLVE